MLIKKQILLLVCLLCFSQLIFSQGEFNTSREPDSYNLNSYGIKLNSNGFGLNYSFQQRKHYRLRRLIEAEYNYFTDIKEIRVINEQFQVFNQRSFVFGKINAVHNFKVGYGYKRMFFEKRDNNSVSIHLLGSAGFSFCISKPVYYKRYNTVTEDIEYTKFDINSPTGNYDIISKAPITMGLSEITFQPGLYAKLGLEFDFAKDIMRASVLSIGIEFDAYLKKIEIMSEKRQNFIPSLYIMYSFGKKYNSVLNREYRKEQRKLERKNK
ncbi:MAG: hypothetical protein LBV69_11645 [Bacteroidales bacterium]|jgi:hypothetical protein|nr:hypothetical protein [Bacteroidales bacterium]